MQQFTVPWKWKINRAQCCSNMPVLLFPFHVADVGPRVFVLREIQSVAALQRHLTDLKSLDRRNYWRRDRPARNVGLGQCKWQWLTLARNSWPRSSGFRGSAVELGTLDLTSFSSPSGEPWKAAPSCWCFRQIGGSQQEKKCTRARLELRAPIKIRAHRWGRETLLLISPSRQLAKKLNNYFNVSTRRNYYVYCSLTILKGPSEDVAANTN